MTFEAPVAPVPPAAVPAPPAAAAAPPSTPLKKPALAAQTAIRATTATPPMPEPTPTPILALELRPKEPPAVTLDDWVGMEV